MTTYGYPRDRIAVEKAGLFWIYRPRKSGRYRDLGKGRADDAIEVKKPKRKDGLELLRCRGLPDWGLDQLQ